MKASCVSSSAAAHAARGSRARRRLPCRRSTARSCRSRPRPRERAPPAGSTGIEERKIASSSCSRPTIASPATPEIIGSHTDTRNGGRRPTSPTGSPTPQSRCCQSRPAQMASSCGDVRQLRSREPGRIGLLQRLWLRARRGRFHATRAAKDGDDPLRDVPARRRSASGSTPRPAPRARPLLRPGRVRRRAARRDGREVHRRRGDGGVRRAASSTRTTRSARVRAARRSATALVDLNESSSGTTARLELRIGVNTGEVVAGTRGAPRDRRRRQRRRAARAGREPGEILLGGDTLRLVRDAVIVEPSSRSS